MSNCCFPDSDCVGFSNCFYADASSSSKAETVPEHNHAQSAVHSLAKQAERAAADKLHWNLAAKKWIRKTKIKSTPDDVDTATNNG